MVRLTGISLLVAVFLFPAHAEDEIELEITTIKGNKELPKILYLVPWKEIKRSKKAERKLVLHSLFGDLFDPVLPNTRTVSSNVMVEQSNLSAN